MSFCTSCYSQVDDGDRKCRACGRRVDSPTSGRALVAARTAGMGILVAAALVAGALTVHSVLLESLRHRLSIPSS